MQPEKVDTLRKRVSPSKVTKPLFSPKKKKKITTGNDEGSEEEVDVTDDDIERAGNGNDEPHWRDAEGPADVDPDGG